MINIAPIIAANAALNAATATANSRQNMRNRKALEMSMKYEAEMRLKERNKILDYYYDQVYEEISKNIDHSKTVFKKGDGFKYKYFDANDNLLMEKSGWCHLDEEDFTTTLYSKETGEKVFSKHSYVNGYNVSESIEHYTNGVCDTEDLLKEHANKLKKKELEAKKETHRAKRRLARMKVKKFLGITSSR